MQKEMESMRTQGVYEEVDVTKLTPQQRQELDLDNIIESRWVYRSKGDEVRARIVAKGYTEHIEDQDDVYASTPLFAVLRILLALSMARGWIVLALFRGCLVAFLWLWLCFLCFQLWLLLWWWLLWLRLWL